MSNYIDLPCNVGDTVYLPVMKTIFTGKVVEIDILSDKCVFVIEYGDKNRTQVQLKQLGKTWFLKRSK